MNHQGFLKYLILSAFFISWLSAHAQLLTAEETIDYIENNFRKHRMGGDDSISIRITENGYVIIKGYTQCRDIKSLTGWGSCSHEFNFHYNSINFKASDQIINIDCHTSDCIEWWKGSANSFSIHASLDMEGIQKITYAFQYLMDVLSYDGKFNNKNGDIFSQDNYLEKVLVEHNDSSKQNINLKYNASFSAINVSVSGIFQDMSFDLGSGDPEISTATENELIDLGVITKQNYLIPGLYKLANDSIIKVKRIKLPFIKVGAFIVKEVICCVNPTNDAQSLGKSFLNRFRKWTINNDDHTLTLER